MYFSLTFSGPKGTRNTWDDYHMIPSSRPIIVLPEAIFDFVEVPGRNGKLDMTGFLTDGSSPSYGQRSNSIEFYIPDEYADQYQEKLMDLAAFLHGQRLDMTMEGDPGWTYHGRWKVNQWKSDKSWSVVTLDYELDPFKTNASGDEAL